MHPRIALVPVAALTLAVSCGGGAPETVVAEIPPPTPVGPTTTGPPHRLVIETDPMRIDRLYPSMTGPAERLAFDTHDLDWVTAFDVEVVDPATGLALGDEFFCHSQLQLPNSTRLMVTATGTAALRFPPGFAMPIRRILSGLPAAERELTLFGMVLNNYMPDLDRPAAIRATVEYWRDEDLVGRPPFRKLFKAGVTLEVEDLAAYEMPTGYDVDADDVARACALVGDSNAHWLVPPGVQVTRKRYRNFLPIDGTVHYALAHLHNHAVSVLLRDVTTGEVLWETRPEYDPDVAQIVRIPPYSSAEGFRMRADHEYEIEARYDNTTSHDIDAMAQIDLYYHPDGDVDITYPNPPS